MPEPVYQGPSKNCPLCPRLAAFREQNRIVFPDKWNAPVPSFGSLDARLLVVGLAPGLKGANFTGRPFTGDYAGKVLYSALLKHGFARGDYRERADDGLQLIDCRITNGARCVPPENKPTPEEVRTCNRFLQSEIAAMGNLRVVLTLGAISHQATLRALGTKPSRFKFGHGGRHEPRQGIILLSSYHCSRYNINTGCLTQGMFDDVVGEAARMLR